MYVKLSVSGKMNREQSFTASPSVTAGGHRKELSASMLKMVPGKFIFNGTQSGGVTFLHRTQKQSQKVIRCAPLAPFSSLAPYICSCQSHISAAHASIYLQIQMSCRSGPSLKLGNALIIDNEKKRVSIFNRISSSIFQVFKVVQIAMERGSSPCSKFHGSGPAPKI